MPTGRDNPPPISPLMAKFAVSSASLLLGMMLSAAAPEAGAAPATLAASIGLPIGEFVKEHLGNLDLHGEDITAWVTRGERDPHRHIRNKDIHAVAGLTIKTLIEGYIKLHLVSAGRQTSGPAARNPTWIRRAAR